MKHHLLGMGLALVVAGCGSVHYRSVGAATTWVVSEGVAESYELSDLQRGLDLWCEGTEGAFCPVVAGPFDGMGHPAVFLNWKMRARGRHISIAKTIELKPGLGPDEVGWVFAHEVGHSIGLRFDDGCDSTRVHACSGLMRGAPDPVESLDETALDAFWRVYETWSRRCGRKNPHPQWHCGDMVLQPVPEVTNE